MWVVWKCDILLSQQWQLFSSIVFPINSPDPNLRQDYYTYKHINARCALEYNCFQVSYMFIPWGTSIHILSPLYAFTCTPSSLLLLYRGPFIFTCNIRIKQHMHVCTGGWYLLIYISGSKWKERIHIHTQYVCENCRSLSFMNNYYMWLTLAPGSILILHITLHQHIDFWLVNEPTLWLNRENYSRQ